MSCNYYISNWKSQFKNVNRNIRRKFQIEMPPYRVRLTAFKLFISISFNVFIKSLNSKNAFINIDKLMFFHWIGSIFYQINGYSNQEVLMCLNCIVYFWSQSLHRTTSARCKHGTSFEVSSHRYWNGNTLRCRRSQRHRAHRQFSASTLSYSYRFACIFCLCLYPNILNIEKLKYFVFKRILVRCACALHTSKML